MLTVVTLLIFPCLGLLLLIIVELIFKSEFVEKITLVAVSKELLLKGVTLLFTISNFIFSLYFILFFDKTVYGFQFIETFSYLDNSITFGLDGISLFFILLTTFLIPICVLVGWETLYINVFLNLVSFLFLEIFLILFFSTLNLFVLYICFESILIPMFIIIGFWGGLRKIKAAYYFFIYTLVGSVFMLLALLLLWTHTGTLNYLELLTTKFSAEYASVFWICFFIGFAVKMPIFPLHLWLPEAHVESPTSGSVILAGLLLKLGGYGFIRLCVSLFPETTFSLSTYASNWCALSVLLASFVASTQADMKKLVAYSSVAHMNFSLFGLFSLKAIGINACVLSMLSHGLVAPAMFIIVDVLYKRGGSRIITNYSGMGFVMPKYVFFLAFFAVSNLGFPGTSSFPGEFLTICAVFAWNSFICLITGTTIIFGAVYSLWFWSKINFGNLKPLGSLYQGTIDINRLEFSILSSLLVSSLYIGLASSQISQIMELSIELIL